MFNNPQVILQDIATSLKQPSSAALVQAGPFWANAVDLPQKSAYNQIVGVLSSRGYSLNQIQNWDRGSEFERVIALYWALVSNGVLSQAGQQYVEKFEYYIRMLYTVSVTINGLFVPPDLQYGQPNVGFHNTANDVFIFPDPNDPMIGVPTKF
jgi:hypothetical protein